MLFFFLTVYIAVGTPHTHTHNGNFLVKGLGENNTGWITSSVCHNPPSGVTLQP